MQSLSRRNFLHLGTAATLAGVSGCDMAGYSKVPDERFSQGQFDASSTAETVTEGLDLSGKTALITGCNSGLGYESMRVLAARGAHVIGTGRTIEKARKACSSVSGQTTPVALELSDFSSAVDCAETVKALGIPLDIVIANAGISGHDELHLIDGIEQTFRINYLGHFILVNNLLPLVKAATNGRIVHVGSAAAYLRVPDGGIDFHSLRGEKSYSRLKKYGQSKLANILFSLQLSKMLAGSDATTNALHPGMVDTNIVRSYPAWFQKAYGLIVPYIAKTVNQGAATQVYVATHPAVAGVNGAYFEDCNPVIVSGDSYLHDEDLAEKLWRVSVQMTRGFIS
jgi:NAD(P)-dependent dehydrogenase (short-subunit alcohol dehydrogenase family)